MIISGKPGVWIAGADIEEFGLQHAKGFASRSPIMNELLQGAEFRKADVTFEREHVVDLGGVRVRLNAVGGTHTRGDTTIFVEGDESCEISAIAPRKAGT